MRTAIADPLFDLLAKGVTLLLAASGVLIALLSLELLKLLQPSAYVVFSICASPIALWAVAVSFCEERRSSLLIG